MRKTLIAAAAALFIGAVAISAGASAAPMCDYDTNHQWHDSSWWFHNNPDWIYQHHPEWIQVNSQWGHDGDWDPQHHWHDRSWWMHNDPAFSDCRRGNADAHLRALLLGHSVSVQISGGELVLGQWQRIVMAELDGPQTRTFRLQVKGAR